MTDKRIIVIGNLQGKENIIKLIENYGVEYIDEDAIEISDRIPRVPWTEKYRGWGWYKQQFIRLCLDRFVSDDYIVFLDSEVFVFDNWDEARFFNEQGEPRLFSWVPEARKPEWDYKMYQGSAYLLQDIPGCEDVMTVANADDYRRHISGLFLWSTANLKKLWHLLTEHNGLTRLRELLLETEFAFSEMELYGLAVKYGLFDDTVKTEIYDGILGWYDVHNEPAFQRFSKDAMWSMCQTYFNYRESLQYWVYMVSVCQHLNRELPELYYWNLEDEGMLLLEFNPLDNANYFLKYRFQLDFTETKRFQSMFTALKLLARVEKPVLVETGTLNSNAMGETHSTYKFAEFAKRFNGKVHTVDSDEASINFCKVATFQYRQFVSYIVSDPIRFLQDFSGKIDFLYLESRDLTAAGVETLAQLRVKELEAAMPKLDSQCIVLMDRVSEANGDDVTDLTQSMEKNGFSLLMDDDQTLYVR